ncbi:hypothetical protein GIB67_032178 [Kingdonia uniflora]|uniref:Squalene monooxygenase n=1 Tax=Kingdonia uniflora TaxID=39325 RepID=A0A7J7MX55_9MAGN|nr:hypothetical protein GIB67_032178 [Kingdonia uniflora]
MIHEMTCIMCFIDDLIIVLFHIGVNKLADLVGVTLGPKGRNVVLESKYGSPKIVNDGVTVAKEVELEDPVKNIGAKLVRQTAANTNDLAGGGITTSVVLAQGLIAEGVKVVTAGANSAQITQSIKKTTKALVAELKLITREVEDSKLADIVAVSAGNNYEVEQMIAKAMSKVGRKGFVTLEEGNSSGNCLYVIEGMQFDRGYISPYFFIDSEKMTVEFENFTSCWQEDHKHKGSHRHLEEAIRGGYPILIIDEDIEIEALATLFVNKLRWALKIAALKAIRFRECKSQYLNDIIILTGALIFIGCFLMGFMFLYGSHDRKMRQGEISNDDDCLNKSCFNNGDLKLEKMGTDDIIVGVGIAGVALAYTLGKDGRRVHVIERDLTEPDRIVRKLLQPGGYLKLLVPGLEDCVDEIDAQRVLGYAFFKDGKNAKLSYPLEKFDYDISERSFHNGRFIQQLYIMELLNFLVSFYLQCTIGTPGILLHLGKVGAQTETELKEKKLRVKDALNATKVAVEERIVVGGGCTLLRLAAKVDAIKLTLDNDEHKVGANIVKKALSYPLKLIAKNTGGSGSIVMEKVLSSDNFKYNHNAASGKYEDLMAIGIIDPTKVNYILKLLVLSTAALVIMLLFVLDMHFYYLLSH